MVQCDFDKDYGGKIKEEVPGLNSTLSIRESTLTPLPEGLKFAYQQVHNRTMAEESCIITLNTIAINLPNIVIRHQVIQTF